MTVNLHKFFHKFPVIELGDIRLRDLMLSDKQEYFEMMSDPEASQYLSDEDVPTSVTETEEEIKYWGGLFYRRQSIFWAIADAKTDKFIGTIGFNNWNFNNRRGEISYDLDSRYWRKGIMTKALTNVILFALKEMDLYRIEARTMLDNEPSRNLLSKIGFKQEGIQRGYRVIRGKPTDITLYSITPSDLPAVLLGGNES